MNNNDLDIRDRMRELRIEQKMTQQLLANRLNITLRTLQNYELHLRKFDSRLMPALFDALGTSPDEFFQWDSSEHQGEERSPILLDDVLPELDNLPTEKIERLYQQVCHAKSLLEVLINTNNKVDYRFLLKMVHQRSSKKTTPVFIYTADE